MRYLSSIKIHSPNSLLTKNYTIRTYQNLLPILKMSQKSTFVTEIDISPKSLEPPNFAHFDQWRTTSTEIQFLASCKANPMVPLQLCLRQRFWMWTIRDHNGHGAARFIARYSRTDGDFFLRFFFPRVHFLSRVSCCTLFSAALFCVVRSGGGELEEAEQDRGEHLQNFPKSLEFSNKSTNKSSDFPKIGGKVPLSTPPAIAEMSPSRLPGEVHALEPNTKHILSVQRLNSRALERLEPLKLSRKSSNSR